MMRPEPNQDGVAAGRHLADLLGGCAGGAQAALREIYELHGRQLYGVALRITRQPSLASDAVQDGFLQIWQHAGRFDPSRGDPFAWIVSIVRYRALDIVRQRGREVLGQEAGDEPDEAPDQLAQLVQGSDEAALHRCMALLNATRQRLLVLAYVEGMTHAELAAHTGHPLGTIKAWMRRSLISLRGCLDQ